MYTFTSFHFFNYCPKPLQVAGNGLRQLKEQAQHLFRRLKPDLQASLAQANPIRQVGQIPLPRPLGNSEPHAAGPQFFPRRRQVALELAAPGGLPGKRLSASHALEFGRQIRFTNKKGLARLIASKPVHQPDGVPPVYTKQIFDSGPIHNRRGVALQTLQGVANLMQPFRFSRHNPIILHFFAFCHSCAISEAILAVAR